MNKQRWSFQKGKKSEFKRTESGEIEGIMIPIYLNDRVTNLFVPFKKEQDSYHEKLDFKNHSPNVIINPKLRDEIREKVNKLFEDT